MHAAAHASTPPEPPAAPGRRRILALAVIATASLLGAAWADVRFGWVDVAFDGFAHQFYEVSMLARIRRASQVGLTRAHLSILATGVVGWLWLAPGLSRHARRCGVVLLAAYAIRAGVWITASNLPLVPGDSCHYVEVAHSIARGDGPVKHYVESFFRDYPAIRANRGVLDDWSMPLYPYIVAAMFRLFGVTPASPIETTFAVAKGTSFVLNLLAFPALYGFARRRFGPAPALGAMALLAVLPVHAIYAGFALRESLVALTSIMAVWLFSEVLAAASPRAALALAVPAGIAGGLAILSRNTALALVAACALAGLGRQPRRRLGRLVVWGSLVLITIAPWGWRTYLEYGQPFYTYTNFYPYNFSWTVHHFEKGNTEPSQFYNAANAPEIARIKLKSLVIVVVTSTMILGLPVMLAFLSRLRGGEETDRLVGVIAAVFVVATLVNVADVTQVAQLGRYYLPLFALMLPSAAVAGLGWLEAMPIARRARAGLAASLAALLWAGPGWAYDATWLTRDDYQLRWPALRQAGDWIRGHPDAVPADARLMTWFPWELRVASDRTTVLMPRNYRLTRIQDVIRQYQVTHLVWGGFEPPPHLEPESWARYLEQLRLGLGLTEGRLLYSTPPGELYPVRIYRVP